MASVSVIVDGTVVVRVSVTVSCRSSVSVKLIVWTLRVGDRVDGRARLLMKAPIKLVVSVVVVAPVIGAETMTVKVSGSCWRITSCCGWSKGVTSASVVPATGTTVGTVCCTGAAVTGNCKMTAAKSNGRLMMSRLTIFRFIRHSFKP